MLLVQVIIVGIVLEFCLWVFSFIDGMVVEMVVVMLFVWVCIGNDIGVINIVVVVGMFVWVLMGVCLLLMYDFE